MGHARAIVDSRLQIREVMTESVVTAAPERTVREVAELMRKRSDPGARVARSSPGP